MLHACVWIGSILFGREAAGREVGGPGGDDQGSARSRESGAERLDRGPVRLAGRRDVREVVDEGGVDDAIRCSRRAPQAVEILESAPMHFGAGGGERLGGCIRPSEAEHSMPRGD